MPTARVTTEQVEHFMADIPSPLTDPASHGGARGLGEWIGQTRRRGGDGMGQGDAVPPRTRPLGGPSKRLADLAVAGVAITLLAPVMLMIALLILVTMGRPVFYAHERIGFRRKPFGCLKFRSMVRDPDETLRRHFLAHPQARREWIDTQKLRDDPRITFVGRMIRKSSLDELPQLLNVVRGEMSCVGPRPVIADELDRYGAREPLYLSVRPGMTGLWQVSGRSSVDYDRRTALDEEYVVNWSLWLDLKILVLTIPAVTKVHDAA
jgi:exopolysaccharide production protein ExoY